MLTIYATKCFKHFYNNTTPRQINRSKCNNSYIWILKFVLYWYYLTNKPDLKTHKFVYLNVNYILAIIDLLSDKMVHLFTSTLEFFSFLG